MSPALLQHLCYLICVRSNITRSAHRASGDTAQIDRRCSFSPSFIETLECKRSECTSNSGLPVHMQTTPWRMGGRRGNLASKCRILPPLPLSKNKRSNSAGCGRPATNSPVLRQHCPAPLAEPSARGHFPTRTAAQPGARCGAIKIMPQQLSWLNTPHRKDAGQFGQCLRTPKRHAVHWPARVPSVFEKFRCRDRQFTTRTRQHVRLV